MKANIWRVLALAGVACTLVLTGACDSPRPAKIEQAGLAAASPPSAVAGEYAGSAAQSAVSSSRRTAITTAVERVSDAVVGISVIQIRYNRRSIFDADPFFRQFFPSIPYRERIKSLGSGFIIDRPGHVLTNAHVVENAVEITVSLTDGSQHSADIVGVDKLSDIALLKIRDPKNLRPIRFGDSADLLIGEWAIALGNPFGLFDLNAKPTVTVGVISALNQDFGKLDQRVYKDMIQTDAAINQGNSGGPLVNALGEVIGMNTFIFGGEGGGSIGLGFAIPAKRLISISKELQKYGRVNRDVRTGIEVDDLTPGVARFLGLKSTHGTMITNIVKGSPGDRAGLRVGDVIYEVEGKGIRNTKDILQIFEDEDIRKGDILHMKVYRKGRTLPVQLQL